MDRILWFSLTKKVKTVGDEIIGTTTDCPDCGRSKDNCQSGKNRGWGRCCSECEQNATRDANHRVRVITRSR